MMKFIAAAGLGLALIACAPADEVKEAAQAPDTQEIAATPTPTPPPTPATDGLEAIDFNSYSEELAKFVGLEGGDSRIAAIDKVRLYFAPEGSEIVQTSQSSFDRPDGSVLLFSVSGLSDDSVKAQEVFLILSGPKEDQSLAAYGMRIKCYRGANTTEWQTELCP